ncbi:MAG: hypothetical protein CMK59_05305 [Proteobacteria bacterium]|nr:hypothetical protein [Pseudomonadota bacterium]
MKSWNLIFASIIMGCSTKETDSATSTTEECAGVDCYGSCLEVYESTATFTLTTEEFTAYINEDGTLTAEQCNQICIDQVRLMDQNVEEVLSCDDAPIDGGAEVTCTVMIQPYCEGRFHDCVPKPLPVEGSKDDQWLLRAAQSERASVQSFLLLAQELKNHGAPNFLITRLQQAAKEEIEHARMMQRLCQERGLSLPPLSEAAPQQRSLLEIAIENAVEGCVHERYAALQAHYQAYHVEDERLRVYFSKIAREETEHTALADDIHTWLMSRLTKSEQTMVMQKQQEAQSALIVYLQNRRAIPTYAVPNAKTAVDLATRLHQMVA